MTQEQPKIRTLSPLAQELRSEAFRYADENLQGTPAKAIDMAMRKCVSMMASQMMRQEIEPYQRHASLILMHTLGDEVPPEVAALELRIEEIRQKYVAAVDELLA